MLILVALRFSYTSILKLSLAACSMGRLQPKAASLAHRGFLDGARRSGFSSNEASQASGSPLS